MDHKKFSGIGTRTRLNVLAGKKIRKGADGKDIFDDYFTDDDDDDDGSDTSEFEPSSVTQKDFNVIQNNYITDSLKSKTLCVSRKDSNLVNDVVADSSKSKASYVTHIDSNLIQNNDQDSLSRGSSNSLAETTETEHPNLLSPDIHVDSNFISSTTCTDKNSLSTSTQIYKKSLFRRTSVKPTRKTQRSAELDRMIDMYDEYDIHLMKKTFNENNTEETSPEQEDDSEHHGSAGEKTMSRSLLHSKNKTMHASSHVSSSKSDAFGKNKYSNSSSIKKNIFNSSITKSTDVTDNFQNDGEVNIKDKLEENIEINIRRKTPQILRCDNRNAIDSTKLNNSGTSEAKNSSFNGANNNTSPLCQNGKPDNQTDGIEITGNILASSETRTDKNEHARSARHNKNAEIVHLPKKRICNSTFSISPIKSKSSKHMDALNSKNNPPLTSVAENNAALGDHQAVVNKTFCKSSDRNEGEQIVHSPNRHERDCYDFVDSGDEHASVEANYGSPKEDEQNSTTKNFNSPSHQSAISALDELPPSKNNKAPTDLTRTLTPKKRVVKSNNAKIRGKQRRNILPSVSPLKKIVTRKEKNSSKLIVNSRTNLIINEPDKSDNARKNKKKQKINLSPPISPSKNNLRSSKRNSSKVVGNSNAHQEINQADNDILGGNNEAAFTTSQISTPKKHADKSNNTRQIKKKQILNISPPISPIKNNPRSVKRKLVENSSAHQMVKEVYNNSIVEEGTNELANSNMHENIEINHNDILGEEIDESDTRNKRKRLTDNVDSAAHKDLGETSGAKYSKNHKTKQQKKVVRNEKNNVLEQQGSSKDLSSSPRRQNSLPSKKREYKKRNRENNEPVRKSSRQRFPPLDRWRNQRPVYVKKGDEMELVKIDSGFKVDNPALAREKLNKIRRKPRKPKKVKLFLPEENCTQSLQLFKKFAHLSWQNFNADKKSSEIDYCLSTSSETDKVAFGFLQIEKDKKKPFQLMKDDDLHLLIIKGMAEVTIQESTCIMSKNDTFIVPRGTFYSIKNIGRGKMHIFYATGQFRFLESTIK